MLTNRNMSDIETCYKCFRAGVIKPLRLSSQRFGMEVEITAMVCKTNARTYEVPISYYGRTYQEGKKIGFARRAGRDGVPVLLQCDRPVAATGRTLYRRRESISAPNSRDLSAPRPPCRFPSRSAPAHGRFRPAKPVEAGVLTEH